MKKMNGVLKNGIVKISQHTGLSWGAALPFALMACCSRELCDLRMTPHELATGRRIGKTGGSGDRKRNG